jgi:hypothetical protein
MDSACEGEHRALFRFREDRGLPFWNFERAPTSREDVIRPGQKAVFPIYKALRARAYR